MKTEDQRLAIAHVNGLEVLGDGSLTHTGILMVRRRELTDWFIQKDWLTDLNAAIQLCDVLKEEGWRWRADNVDESGKILFTFYKPNSGVWYHGTGDFLSSAICEAFLKVKGLCAPSVQGGNEKV